MALLTLIRQSRIYGFIDLVVALGFVNIFLAQTRFSMCPWDLLVTFQNRSKIMAALVWNVQAGTFHVSLCP